MEGESSSSDSTATSIGEATELLVFEFIESERLLS